MIFIFYQVVKKHASIYNGGKMDNKPYILPKSTRQEAMERIKKLEKKAQYFLKSWKVFIQSWKLPRKNKFTS